MYNLNEEALKAKLERKFAEIDKLTKKRLEEAEKEQKNIKRKLQTA